MPHCSVEKLDEQSLDDAFAKNSAHGQICVSLICANGTRREFVSQKVFVHKLVFNKNYKVLFVNKPNAYKFIVVVETCAKEPKVKVLIPVYQPQEVPTF